MTIPEAGEIWAGETISRYVEHDAEHGESWVSLLEPYYLYRPLAMLVPWVFFVPGAMFGPWMKRFKTKPGAMRLWWIVLIACVLLSFSRGRRWYYMLPVLVPYTVLLASTAVQFAGYLRERNMKWAWSALFALHAIAISVVAIVHGGAGTPTGSGKHRLCCWRRSACRRSCALFSWRFQEPAGGLAISESRCWPAPRRRSASRSRNHAWGSGDTTASTSETLRSRSLTLWAMAS